MPLDIDKLNKMLPMCLSPQPGDRQAAWNRVEHFLMTAIGTGNFMPSDFQMGRRAIASENIQDLMDRELAYQKSVIAKKNTRLAFLERQIEEAANTIGGVDVGPYIKKIAVNYEPFTGEFKSFYVR